MTRKDSRMAPILAALVAAQLFNLVGCFDPPKEKPMPTGTVYDHYHEAVAEAMSDVSAPYRPRHFVKVLPDSTGGETNSRGADWISNLLSDLVPDEADPLVLEPGDELIIYRSGSYYRFRAVADATQDLNPSGAPDGNEGAAALAFSLKASAVTAGKTAGVGKHFMVMEVTDPIGRVYYTLDVIYGGLNGGFDDALLTISDATVANPTVLTVTDHRMQDGETALIQDSTGITPSLDGEHVATVIDADHISIPVNVTAAVAESAQVSYDGIDIRHGLTMYLQPGVELYIDDGSDYPTPRWVKVIR